LLHTALRLDVSGILRYPTFLLRIPPPPPPTLFPYTTLFRSTVGVRGLTQLGGDAARRGLNEQHDEERVEPDVDEDHGEQSTVRPDRKSTRLNSSHVSTSYAVVCLEKEKAWHIDPERASVDVA